MAWRSWLPGARIGMSLLLLGVLASALIGLLIGFDGSSSSGGTGSERTAGQVLGRPNLPPCKEQTPAQIAVLGRLAPGRDISSLLARGFFAVPAIDGIDENLVVIAASGRQIDPEELRNEPALVASGPLGSHTLDPALSTCDYRLSDNEAATALMSAATSVMIERGMLTREQIDAGGTTFQVAEDPTDASRLFLTVLLAKPLQQPGHAGTPISDLLIPYVAVMDKASSAILGVGRAHWYDGQ